MKVDRNYFAAKHADEHFSTLASDHKAKIRMPMVEARCLLIRHPQVDDGITIFETYAKSVGAGVYEVSLREARP